MGAIRRGLRNPFRNVVRTAVTVLLLALVLGLLALMVQAARLSREQLGRLEARVRTLIELREAGAFGTGGFGADKPVGEEDFSVHTLERIKRIPHAPISRGSRSTSTPPRSTRAKETRTP